MAEALGITAAALQIADTTMRMRRLWQGLKEMPSTVQGTVEEVGLLADTLSQIQNAPVPNDAIRQNHNAWSDCHRSLCTVSGSFKSLVNDLDRQIAKHPKRGSVRAYLRRDELDQYCHRLERLKTTMILARLSYSEALQSHQNSVIVNMLQNMGNQQQKATTDILSSMTTGDTMMNGDEDDDTQSLVTRSRPYSSNLRPKRMSKRYCFQVPAWIFHKSVQILVDRSHGAWNLNLRVYNRVPWDAEVLVAARRGRWDEVQTLFAKGEASPFDYGGSHSSLLHIAADRADVDGCRFLLQQGVDPYLEFNNDLIPLACLGLFYLLEKSRNKIVSSDAARVIQILAPSIESHVEHRDGFSFYEFPADAISTMIASLPFSYTTIEPLRRAKALVNYRGGDAHAVPLLLGSDLLLWDAFVVLAASYQESGVTHRDFLGNLATGLVQRVRMHDDNALQSYIREWQPIVGEVISFERQFEQLLPYQCLLTWFLAECCKYDVLNIDRNEHGTIWSRKLTSAARIWVQFLASIGVDLNRYANAERDCFRATQSMPVYTYQIQQWFIRINGLSCGPCVEDWYVYAVPFENGCPREHDGYGEYEMARSFWSWIEEPELSLIPGSYPVCISDADDWLKDFIGSDPFCYRTSASLF